jgi:hypothetical protein
MKGKVGYVAKSQVHLWTTREALVFTPLIRSKDRPEIAAWDDRGVFDEFMASADSSANPPAFRETISSGLRSERSYRPYPVIGTTMQRFAGSVDKHTYRVLAPVNMPRLETLAHPGEVGAKVNFGISTFSNTFVFAFDATASNGPLAEKIAKSVRTGLEALPKDVQDNTKIGFVFFRDKEDTEKIAITPEPMTVSSAMYLLQEVATRGVSGGGDVADPVLDAVYVAGLLFPWPEGSVHGKRVVVAVLTGAAKAMTEGAIDDRVPAGLDASAIGARFRDEGIPVIAVQAGEDFEGGQHVKVLSTLANATNGDFIAWESDESPPLDRIIAAIASSLTRTLPAPAVPKEKPTAIAPPTIPLEIVDGAKVGRLRTDGLKFNIDVQQGGDLVREAFMMDTEGVLFRRNVEVEKSTLQKLVRLLSAIAGVGAPAIDSQDWKRSVHEAMAAIAGETFDPKEPIGTLVSKRLGINFNTPMLEFDLDFLIAMTPAERDLLLKQIRKETEGLNKFMADNQDALNSQPAVWMDAELLP